ncbi:DUF6083 domain-containing protein [Streptomyces bungoensis]|uniref:DUF6083 domain-containing protein n=1 Tax=Streptomyces bungoensis TaxID=285568 RepID=UPI00344015C8
MTPRPESVRRGGRPAVNLRSSGPPLLVLLVGARREPVHASSTDPGIRPLQAAHACTYAKILASVFPLVTGSLGTSCWVPPAGFEPAHTAPLAQTVSAEHRWIEHSDGRVTVYGVCPPDPFQRGGIEHRLACSAQRLPDLWPWLTMLRGENGRHAERQLQAGQGIDFQVPTSLSSCDHLMSKLSALP